MSGKQFPTVTINGQPLPMPRPRPNRYGGVGTPKAIREYKKAVAKAAEDEWAEYLEDMVLPLKGACRLRLEFARATMVRADLDNLIKAVQDALLGIAYQDDHQVSELVARKIHGAKRPRVEITLYDLEAIP